MFHVYGGYAHVSSQNYETAVPLRQGSDLTGAARYPIDMQQKLIDKRFRCMIVQAECLGDFFVGYFSGHDVEALEQCRRFI